MEMLIKIYLLLKILGMCIGFSALLFVIIFVIYCNIKNKFNKD